MNEQRDKKWMMLGGGVILVLLGLAVVTVVGYRQLSAAASAYHLVDA